MKDSEYRSADLLSNDSFLKWINNDASAPEKRKWQQWMAKKAGREIIVKRAKKLANMPFREFKGDGIIFEELRNLKQKLRKDENSNA